MYLQYCICIWNTIQNIVFISLILIIFILNMQIFYSNWEKIVVLFLHYDCIVILNPQMYLYWVKFMHHNEREEMNDFERCEKFWELSEGWTEWHSGIWVIISSYGTSLPVPGYKDPLKEKEMNELKCWFPNVI